MILGTSGVIWGGSRVILKCRITLYNYLVEPSIQNHNQGPGLFVSTQLLPDSTQNRFAFFTSLNSTHVTEVVK